ncbi:choice-of-anchor D domain-containing protein [Leptolyngbya sp. PCC 6406]|uniref:choice-of-anchor D domain-containing protein n=1 Tax=Leptolyngbya sp. PCC 6406 TaxID=1173264 RepID=UPI0002AC6FCC|nr:choice-of-anchor D domain-containing protein [Leptolyngbya sp. PCC 6406]
MVTTAPHPRSTPAPPPQPDLLGRAKAGDAPAIAALIRRALGPQHIAVEARWTADEAATSQGRTLHLTLRAIRLPSAQVLVPFLRQGLLKLGMADIEAVVLYGQQAHASDWREDIALGADPSTPMPSPAESPIQAHIQADSLSGQVAIGNHILQIGSISGGIVNLTPSREGEAMMRPLPTPILLRPLPFPNLLDRVVERRDSLQTLLAAQSVECHSAPGMGKTALLRYIAHQPQVAEPFPDGVVYLSVRQRSPLDILQAIFDAYHDTEGDWKPTESQLRRALQGTRSLILLDDVTLGREDLEWLMNAVPGCGFWFNTPTQQLWAVDITALSLEGLPQAEALVLMEQQLQRPLTPEEHPAAIALWRHLGGHPRQILQAIAQMQHQSPTSHDHSLQAVLLQFAGAETGEAKDTAIAQTATSLPQPVQQILGVLTLLAGVAIGKEALAAIVRNQPKGAIADVPSITTALATLQQLHWVTPEAGGYRLASNLQAPLAQQLDLTAWHQPLLTYVTTWVAQPGLEATLPLAQIDLLERTLDIAHQTQQWVDVWTLGHSLDLALSLGKQWGRWQRLLWHLADIAQATENATEAAWIWHQLGTQALCQGDAFTAWAALSTAWEQRQQLGDGPGTTHSLHNLQILQGSGAFPRPQADTALIIPQPPLAHPDPPRSYRRPLGLGLGAILLLGGVGMGLGWLGRVATPLPLVSRLPMLVEPMDSFPVAMEPDEIPKAETQTQETSTSESPDPEPVSSVIPDVRDEAPPAVGRLQFGPQSLRFSEQTIGVATAPQTVTLSNVGTATVPIPTLTLAGAHPQDFTARGCGQSQLEPGKSCTLTVQFTPQGEGPRTAQISLPQGDVLTIQGAGAAVDQPKLGVNPSKLHLVLGQPGELILENEGTAPLRVTGWEVVGAGATAYQVRGDCGSIAVEPGKTCRVTVEFKPATARPDHYPAQLQILSNDPAGPTVVDLIADPPVWDGPG